MQYTYSEVVLMFNKLSSIQNQTQTITPAHHGGHGKKINPPVRNLKNSFKSKLFNVNPDAHPNQQNKQEQEKSPKRAPENKVTEKPYLGLDKLEIIGQVNRLAIYTTNNIKND
jgi:hypothetical protein